MQHARDMPSSDGHERIEQQAERVQADADPHRAVVARAEIFCSRPGETMKAGREQGEVHQPDAPPCQKSQ